MPNELPNDLRLAILDQEISGKPQKFIELLPGA